MTSASCRSLPIWLHLTAGAFAVLPLPVSACVELNEPLEVLGETIALIPGDSLPGAILEEAVGLWRSCGAYGTGFPAFAVAAKGTRTVTVDYFPGGVGAGHCGTFRGIRIALFGFARDAAGEVHRCGDPAESLAHELGHALGLAEATRSPSCRNFVMSSRYLAGKQQRRVQELECRLVARRWLTFREAVGSNLAASRRLVPGRPRLVPRASRELGAAGNVPER